MSNLFDNIPEFTTNHYEQAESIKNIADKYSEYSTIISMPLVVIIANYDKGRYKETHVIDVVACTTSSKYVGYSGTSSSNDKFLEYSDLLHGVRELLDDFEID